jgi:hypothetical protein
MGFEGVDTLRFCSCYKNCNYCKGRVKQNTTTSLPVSLLQKKKNQNETPKTLFFNFAFGK